MHATRVGNLAGVVDGYDDEAGEGEGGEVLEKGELSEWRGILPIREGFAYTLGHVK
jgi:hypothetical protein